MDFVIHRRKYYSTEFDLTKCPECDAETIEKITTIMLTVKSDKDVAQFFAGTKGIHFCPNCPVVVFNSSKIENVAMSGIRANRNVQYFIMGMVDFDSIPEEKKHLQFGSEENPVPLVEFLPNLGLEENTTKRSYRKFLVTKKPKKLPVKLPLIKRIGRNQFCPCGSRKKYKKCCGK